MRGQRGCRLGPLSLSAYTSSGASRVRPSLPQPLGAGAPQSGARRRVTAVRGVTPPRRLEDECVDLLQTALCPPVRPEPLQLLCAAILRETAPRPGLRLSCDRVQSPRQLSLVASVLLAQVARLPRWPPPSVPWAPSVHRSFRGLRAGRGGQHMDARPADRLPCLPSSRPRVPLPVPGRDVAGADSGQGCHGHVESP